jgi:hypothetical protein
MYIENAVRHKQRENNNRRTINLHASERSYL